MTVGTIKRVLFYRGEEYEVERFDKVTLRHEGWQFDGVVMIVHPRNREVTVTYQDDLDTRRDGDPKKKRVRTSIDNVDLIARDG
jgi:hypothetical protein